MKEKAMIGKGNGRFIFGMTAPTMLILLIMTVYPVIFTIVYSFTDYNYLKGIHPFIALENYVKLFENVYFRQAVFNTVLFTVLPAVTVALIWRMMLSPNYGIANQLLQTIGLPVFNWFRDPNTAFGTILVIDIWQNTPFAFLLLYACLQGVPDSQYEAAAIDGAGYFQSFWHVTLPNITGGLALCAMLRTIDTFRLFEKVNILTGGGPANTTSTITQYMYTYGIKTLDFGFASACAIVMTVFVLILSAVYIKRAVQS